MSTFPGIRSGSFRAWNGAEYVGWYVNVAAPWRRTPIGFDTVDHILDIQVTDDLSDWSWKDQDELAWAVVHGQVSASKAEAIRQHGNDATARMNARAHPFHDDWSDTAPDPEWPIPVLPPAFMDVPPISLYWTTKHIRREVVLVCRYLSRCLV